MKTAMSIVDDSAKASEFASALASAITPSVQRMAEETQKRVLRQVDTGKTALEQGTIWTPEKLGSMTVSEEGSGDEKNTATAIVTSSGNIKLTLGLVKINDKWMLISAGGNKKSALDTARVFKVRAENRAAEFAQRRKRNELFLKEFSDLFAAMGNIEKVDEERRKTVLYALGANLQKIQKGCLVSASKMSSAITLQSPELWENVENRFLSLEREFRATPVSQNEASRSLENELKKNPDLLKNMPIEVVFQNGDTLILRIWTIEASPDASWHKQWLSGELDTKIKEIFIYFTQNKISNGLLLPQV